MMFCMDSLERRFEAQLQQQQQQMEQLINEVKE